MVETISRPLASPWIIERVEGLTATLKSNVPGGTTTRLNAAVRVTPLPAAWMARVVVEPGAVIDAVRVTVGEQVGLQLAGVKTLAVTPVGRGVVTLNAIEDVRPVSNVAVAVSTPLGPPCTMVRVAGESARLKSKVQWPVTVKVTEPVAEPLVPVTVTVWLPQKELALTVRVEVRILPGARTRLDGLREAVKLDVNVVADRATVPENPLTLATIIVAFVDEPETMVADAGFTLRAKPGTGEPTRVIVFTMRSVL